MYSRAFVLLTCNVVVQLASYHAGPPKALLCLTSLFKAGPTTLR